MYCHYAVNLEYLFYRIEQIKEAFTLTLNVNSKRLAVNNLLSWI